MNRFVDEAITTRLIKLLFEKVEKEEIEKALNMPGKPKKMKNAGKIISESDTVAFDAKIEHLELGLLSFQKFIEELEKDLRLAEFTENTLSRRIEKLEKENGILDSKFFAIQGKLAEKTKIIREKHHALIGWINKNARIKKHLFDIQSMKKPLKQDLETCLVNISVITNEPIPELD